MKLHWVVFTKRKILKKIFYVKSKCVEDKKITFTGKTTFFNMVLARIFFSQTVFMKTMFITLFTEPDSELNLDLTDCILHSISLKSDLTSHLQSSFPIRFSETM